MVYKDKPLWFGAIKLLVEKGGRPMSKEKLESRKRKPSNMENYVKNGDGWKCKDCEADILGAQVARPVWIRGFAGGGGECRYDTLPYCPNCEKKPNFHGAPVYAD